MISDEVDSPLPMLKVKDTRLGLGEMAAAWRKKSAIPLVAITGSNGKTTVKEMISSILGVSASVLATQGNFNNDIGVPLTLLRLQDEAYAVVEMGASGPGEIKYLSQMAQPNVAVLNNACRSHLEGFGSIEGVATALLLLMPMMRGRNIGEAFLLKSKLLLSVSLKKQIFPVHQKATSLFGMKWGCTASSWQIPRQGQLKSIYR